MERRRAFVLTALLLGTPGTPARAEPVPLTLRQAIAEALASSPRLRAPDDGRTLAKIRERQAAARFGIKLSPNLQTNSDPAGFGQRTLGLGVSKRLPFGTDLTFNANTVRYGEGAEALRDNGYTVSLSQPLMRGFGAAASADLTLARRAETSAGRMYVDARQQLVVSVAEAYVTVLRAHRFMKTAERSLERARRLRILSDARSKVGLATELDVLRADLLASQSEAAMVAQSETLEAALDGLKNLIGRPLDAAVDLIDDLDGVRAALGGFSPGSSPSDGGPAPNSMERFIETALSARVDVGEARDRVGDARLAEKVAQWNLLPPVNFDMSYTRRGLGPGSSDLFSRLFNGWRFGVSTSYGLDRSDESAAAAAASVSTRAVAQASADTERRVAEEVRRAYRAWTRTAAAVEIESKAVGLAERQLRLAQIRYERGVAGNFDVVDAENNVFQAQSGLISAEAERALAGLTLRRVTGTLDPDSFRP